jgi:hypothetical protein
VILDKQKVIFIHIPKSAGASMSEFLAVKPTNNVHHKDLAILTNIKKGMYTDYFKFAIVRNPFARLVSVYGHYIGGGNKSQHDRSIQEIFRALKYSGFVRNINNLSSIIPSYEQDLHPCIMSQYEYICDNNGDVLLDYIIYFERLQEGVDYIGERLNIQREFPHRNNSGSQHKYQDFYTQELIDIVAGQYRKDISLFYPRLSAVNGRI